MNILIPHSWLLDHLDTDATPAQIQQYLSLSGPSVERIYDRDGDSVYDIEVTTNRVDAMSVRGIAREAAVILNQFGVKAQLKPLQLPDLQELQPVGEVLPLPKIFNNPDLNKRTICVVLKNVKRSKTPNWMAERLLHVDMNVHDAVIDITNYITHDLGHPCHAFDYDKLAKTGGEIHIEEAAAGETFTTLDGNTFTTVGGEVVFKNGKGEIIDLPSIKGTKNTSIDESTKNVLLLLESIRADKVRFASMTHAIRTVAAQLMEKNVDPNLAEPTLIAGVQLYQKLCGASIGSEPYDHFTAKQPISSVSITVAQIDAYLGLEIDLPTITSILEQLGCTVELEAKEGRKSILHVTPPTFRPDISIPADIIEEIARIYGYHNLPSKLMDTPIPLIKPTGVNFAVENKIKHFLADIGWQEVYGYSMVSKEIATQSGYALKEHLKLANPLTDDHIYLRRSLLPTLEEIIAENPNRSELSVFEIANTYTPRAGELPEEKLQLALVSTRSYRVVRGELEALLEQFFIPEYNIKVDKNPAKAYLQSATVSVKNISGNVDKVGVIGVLHSGHIGISLMMEKLLEAVRTHPKYQPIPKTMPIIEDMTFTLPRTTQVGNVIEDILSVAKQISLVEVKDIYKQNVTFSITYHDRKHMLSAEEVRPLREKIVYLIQADHHGKLVGAV